IRNAYVQIAPQVAPFLISSIHDDSAGVLETYGEPEVLSGVAAFLHGLTTAGGMISTINGILAAALAGVIVMQLGASLTIALMAAAIAFVVMFAGVNRYALNTIVRFEQN